MHPRKEDRMNATLSPANLLASHDWRAIADSRQSPPWVIQGRAFSRPWADERTEPTAEENAEIRQSILESGILDAVIVDEHDNVIDGDVRLRFAVELRIPLSEIPITIKAGLTDEQKRKMVRDLNEKRKHLTPEELAKRRAAKVAQATEELRQELGAEPSVRAVADRAKVPREVAMRLKPPPQQSTGGRQPVERTRGQDGKLRPPPLSPEERERRDERIVALLRQGKSMDQAAEEEGCSKGTVARVAARAQDSSPPPDEIPPAFEPEPEPHLPDLPGADRQYLLMLLANAAECPNIELVHMDIRKALRILEAT